MPEVLTGDLINEMDYIQITKDATYEDRMYHRVRFRKDKKESCYVIIGETDKF